MSRFEYKIVPAPNRGLKGKGIKGPEARFANALEDTMNTMAAEGWEYQRAETLPSVERSGLTSTTTEWRNVLVFRRLRDSAAEATVEEAKPDLLPAPGKHESADAQSPKKTADEAANTVDKQPVAEPAKVMPLTKDDRVVTTISKSHDVDDEIDNGVEDTNDVSAVSSSLGKLAEVRKLSKTES